MKHQEDENLGGQFGEGACQGSYRRRRHGGLAGLVAVVALARGDSAGAREAPPAAQRFDIVYSPEVTTPHVPWATRLPGGPLRGFFIPSVSGGRDMVELMQRLSLDPTTVTIDRQWDVNCWGIGDFYGHEYRGDRDDFQTVYRYAEEELTSDKPFEVMLIPGLNGWSRLSRASRDAVLRRVRDGAGLVLLHPFVGDLKGHPFKGDEPEGDARIWDLSPLVGVPDDFVSERGYPERNAEAITEARWERAKPHFITEGVPLDLLPSGKSGGRFYKYQTRGDVLIQAGGHPVLASRVYGKGRVVSFAYVEDGFLPEPIDPVESRIAWDYWEYQYGLLSRSLLWAAGRDHGVALASPRMAGAGGLALDLEITSARARQVEIEIAARSEFTREGDPKTARREQRTLSPGRSVVSLSTKGIRPERGWPGGRQIVDVVVREEESGATLDWGTATFDVPKRATVTGVRPNAEVYRQGDTLSVVTRAAGNLDGLRMRLEVRDDLGRLLHTEEKPTPGEKAFVYRLDDFVGKRALLTASLVEEGVVVDRLPASPVVVVQRERRPKEYRGLLSFENPRHSLAPLRQRRLRSLAMDSGFTWGGKVNDSLEVPRGWFGVYWYDRGPATPEGLEAAIREFEKTGDVSSLQYLTKKELFRRTGDKRFLIRSPSFDDPDVRRTLADIARTAARNKAVYNMDYYFVGDEGSLTSYTDPVDFCFGPHTLASFRRWLEAQNHSLEALNRSWRSAFGEWSDVVPATTEEARTSGVFPPWADHRRYMEESFAGAYQAVRDAVVQGDPEGRIALSGTQVTTPWNGADWFRLDQVIDDFLSYDGGNQWDMHRSFAKPGARIGFWTGYGRSGVGVRHEIWSAALQGVLFPNLFWSYSVVNPDLTWSRSGRDMGAAFQALRFEGIGALLMEAERLGDGIAVHYSMPSVHAAGILGLHDRPKKEEDQAPGFPANRDGWVRGLTDLGLTFDFIASPQVEAGGLDPARFKVFVMPLSLAVSPREAAAIAAFARAGGIVIADGAPGLFDDHCAWAPQGQLNGLFGIDAASSEKRALRAPKATGGVVTVRPEGKAWGLDAATLAGLRPFEAGIEARGGQPLLDLAGTPGALARRVGRGWALYLNVLFDQYPAQRMEHFGGSAYRELLSGVLDHLGVRPAIRLRDGKGHHLGPARVARYRFGEAEVAAVLLEPTDVAEVYGRDGVRVYDDSNLGRVAAAEIEVALPLVADVVDARSGAFLGHTDRVKTTVSAGDALILGLSRARPGLSVSGPAAVARGEHPRFTVTSSLPGRLLVTCQVYGPGGALVPEYSRTLRFDGTEGSFAWPTALNDPAGSYRLKVRDVVGGAEAVVELR